MTLGMKLYVELPRIVMSMRLLHKVRKERKIEMKKMFLTMLVALCLMFSLTTVAFAEDSQVPADAVAKVNETYYNNLDSAIAAANDGNTVLLVKDVKYTGTSTLTIEKKITLDLNGYTLTTSGTYGGIIAKNNCSIINGTINHNGTVAAIKAWNVERFENLKINVAKKEGKTIGGIVVQSGSTVCVGIIKNTQIIGATNGIETYNCGNAENPVIGEMDNVTIEALDTGLLLSAPCGTAKNCNISGGNIGINMYRKGTYSVALALENCKVEGALTAIYLHDENFYNEAYINTGKLELTVDDETVLTSTSGNPVAQSEIGLKENVTVSIESKDGVCPSTDQNGKVNYLDSHTYGTSWKSDANGHYHECTVCGAKGTVTAHSFQWVIDKNATANAKGSKHEECSVCGYKKDAVEIPVTAPATGDATNIVGVFALLLASGYVLAKKRKVFY